MARKRNKKQKHDHLKYMRDWKRKNKESEKKKRRLDYSTVHGRARNLYHTSKRRAKLKGFEFSLTMEWIERKLTVAKCELSGLRFSLDRKNPHTPSVDRKDSSKGYTPDNCRVICWALNSAFNLWGEIAFREVAWAWFLRASPNLQEIIKRGL